MPLASLVHNKQVIDVIPIISWVMILSMIIGCLGFNTNLIVTLSCLYEFPNYGPENYLSSLHSKSVGGFIFSYSLIFLSGPPTMLPL